MVAEAIDLAAPYLIEVVQSPRGFEDPPLGTLRHESRAERALTFLEPGKHRELIPIFQRLARENDPDVMNIIGRHLMAFGSKDLLEAGRRGVEEGVLEALRNGNADPEFRRVIWNRCIEWLESGSYGGDPARFLVLIDKEKAKEVLSQPHILNAKHRLLAAVIRGLNGLGSPPPEDFLQDLIASRSASENSDDIAVVNEALRGLSLRNLGEANRIAEEVIAHWENFPTERVLAAWDIRFQAAGRTRLAERASEAYQAAGSRHDSLSRKFRTVLMIQQLDGEDPFDTLLDWYVSSGGGYAKEMADALEEIGALKHADLIREGNRLFGWFGPSRQQAKRQQRAEQFTRAETDKMVGFIERYRELPSALIFLSQWEWRLKPGE